MEGDTKTLFDQPGDSAGRPQLGSESEDLGAVMKPAEHLLRLFGGQMRGATGTRLRRQSSGTFVAVSFDPPPHRPIADAEKLGDIDLRIAGLDSLHCQAPASFEFLARP